MPLPDVSGVSGVAVVSRVWHKPPMNKKEAAAYLGLSTRAVERAVARGKLSTRYRKDRRGHVAVFDPSEVRRYKADVDNPFPKGPSVEPPVPAPPTAAPGQPPRILHGFTGAVEYAPAGAPAVPVADKLTLSLAEASCLSGLSEEFLLQAIGDKQLKAFKHGAEWRVKRADLDSFVRGL